MLCNICKKNPAVIFSSKEENDYVYRVQKN